MKFRYTKDMLKKSDMWLLLRILQDRKDGCTNIYSPLYVRLSAMQFKIQDKLPLTDCLVLGSWMSKEDKE